MAKPHPRHNAGGAFTNNSNTLNPIPAVFYTFILASAQVFAFTPASASVSGPLPLGRYTDKNLQKTIKLAPKLFVKSQKYGQL